jgi:hypothetical protein
MKLRRMSSVGHAVYMGGGMIYAYRVLMGNLMVRDCFEDLGLCERMILKWTCKK